LLTYFNGGFTEANFKQVNYLDAALGTPTGLVLGSQRREGFFLGGGTEYAISQIPGLFWKSEYRFADYGRKDFGQLCTVTGPCGVGGTIHSIDSSRTFVQTATTELVYRFNWGGPVVAKY
jgi:outer membrane immunogenic protein